MGRAWLPSQRHGRELESGEPACLPLFSQRALFVACFHRLSRRRAPWLPFFSILPITAYFTLTYSTPQRGNMSSSSPHIVLKGPSVPCGSSSSADRSAEPSPSFIYLSIRLPVFMPCHLSPVFICSQRISQ